MAKLLFSIAAWAFASLFVFTPGAIVGTIALVVSVLAALGGIIAIFATRGQWGFRSP